MMPIVHLGVMCVCSIAWVLRESHYNLDILPAICCGEFYSVPESSQ